MRNYGYAIDQILSAGDDHFISWLDAIEHHIVVADDLADLQRLLVDYISAFLVRFGNEREIKATDSRDGYHRNDGLFLAPPDDSGSYELSRTQAVV